MQEEIRRSTWEAPWAPAAGRFVVGHTAIEAHKGKPGNGAMPEPAARDWNVEPRKAEKYCERERPPDADGESYQA
jgi:hypothetical protein